jgi:hypothetical protein
MELWQALDWVKKNSSNEVLERLRSRKVSKTLADEVIRLRSALTVMVQSVPCDCGCINKQKPLLLNPMQYRKIAKEALDLD